MTTGGRAATTQRKREAACLGDPPLQKVLASAYQNKTRHGWNRSSVRHLALWAKFKCALVVRAISALLQTKKNGALWLKKIALLETHRSGYLNVLFDTGK
jgi:hypothetical protein